MVSRSCDISGLSAAVPNYSLHLIRGPPYMLWPSDLQRPPVRRGTTHPAWVRTNVRKSCRVLAVPLRTAV